jgi:hypothetical protein
MTFGGSMDRIEIEKTQKTFGHLYSFLVHDLNNYITKILIDVQYIRMKPNEQEAKLKKIEERSQEFVEKLKELRRFFQRHENDAEGAVDFSKFLIEATALLSKLFPMQDLSFSLEEITSKKVTLKQTEFFVQLWIQIQKLIPFEKNEETSRFVIIQEEENKIKIKNALGEVYVIW